MAWGRLRTNAVQWNEMKVYWFMHLLANSNWKFQLLLRQRRKFLLLQFFLKTTSTKLFFCEPHLSEAEVALERSVVAATCNAGTCSHLSADCDFCFHFRVTTPTPAPKPTLPSCVCGIHRSLCLQCDNSWQTFLRLPKKICSFTRLIHTNLHL